MPVAPLAVALTKLVPSLSATQPVADPRTGRASGPFRDMIESWRDWFSRNVVDLQTKVTTVEGTTGTLSGRVDDVQSVVANADGSLTAQRLTTVSTTAANAAGKAQDALSVVQNPDGSVTAQKLTTVKATADSAQAGANNATANGQVYLAARTAPTGSSAAFGVYLTAGAAYCGFEMLALSAGGSAIGLTASQFLFTDSGTATAILAYSGGLWSFNSNVSINGNLVVNGTITNPQLGANAASFSAGGTTASGTNPSRSDTLTLRANMRVKVWIVFMPDSGVGGTTSPGATLSLSVDGVGKFSTPIVYQVSAVNIGASNAVGAACTVTQIATTTPGLFYVDNLAAGSHTFVSSASGAVIQGKLSVVIEAIDR